MLFRKLNSGNPDLESRLRRSSGEGKGDIFRHKPLQDAVSDSVQSSLGWTHTALASLAPLTVHVARSHDTTTTT